MAAASMAAVYNSRDREEEQPILDTQVEILELLQSEDNVPRIEAAAQKFLGESRELMEKHDPNSISRTVAQNVIQKQRERFYGCLQFPISILLFSLYCSSVAQHEEINSAYLLETGIKGALGDGTDGIEDVAGVWDWLEGNFLDAAFKQQDFLGNEYTDKSMWSRVLTYNQITGAIVIEQLRSKMEMCNGAKGIAGDMYCFDQRSRSKDSFGKQVTPAIAPVMADTYAGGNASMAERKAYYDSAFSVSSLQNGRRLARTTRAEYDSKLPSSRAEDDQFLVTLFPNTPKHLIQEHLNYLKEKEWLDAQTKYLRVSALLVNAETGRTTTRPRLVQFVFQCYFARSGGVFIKTRTDTVFLEDFASDGSIVTDIFFLLFFVSICVMEAISLARAVKAGSLKKHLRTFRRLMEALTISVGGICIACFCYQVVLRGRVVDAFKDAVDAQIQDMPADTNQQGTAVSVKASDYGNFAGFSTRVYGMYCLVLMVRVFVAFGVQPRLAMVVKTFEVAAYDIIHFLVVLLPTLIAYSLAGCFIFGRRMEEFASLDASIGYCFKLLVEGEYDWPYYTEEQYWTSLFWIWSFMILLNVIMLNMVLAILLDVYSAVRAQDSNTETVGGTLWNYVVELWYRKVWVSSSALLEALPNMPQDIRREDFVATFPTMCEVQLDMIMDACLKQVAVDNLAASKGTHAMKLALSCKLAMDRMSETVKALQEGTAQPVNKESGPGSSWIKDLANEVAAQNHMMQNLQWKLQQVEWQWKAMENVHGTAPKLANVQPKAAGSTKNSF